MKTYIKFLINLFNNSFFKVFTIFFMIIFILNIFEQVEFFKNTNLNFPYLVFLSFLNTPSIIFEILPFIFLLSTQVFFIYLIDRNEIEILKYSGLNNFKIIKILSIYTFMLGFIFIIIFYNISSVLQNSYLLIKNKYSDDNKYLAVITGNGLWLKDEIDNKINIINSNKVDNQFLLNVTITQLNKNFEVLNLIKSSKVDITNYNWKIFNPIVMNNNTQVYQDEMVLRSNFDLKKINSLFSNLSSLSVIELFELRNSYKSLNYSIIDIDAHLYKIISLPIYLTLISIFASIIMFNISYQQKAFFKIVFGIFFSVIIYYINYFINVLGINGKIPLILSVVMPLILLSIINFISIIRVNEK